MKKVLVVEDSKAEQRLMVGLLKGLGLDVALTNSAEEAIIWLNNNGQPDLILTDIVMPDMSGLDLCRHIRTNFNFGDVPIVFCSQKSQEFDRFWALRQGGNGYIVKPYSPADLMQTVQDFLK